MKNIVQVSLIVLAGIVLAACGAATAPPVDLPAPVVGRITVGAPDASGKSTITGTDGAVTANQNVMAINTGAAAATTGMLWKVTDALVAPAYAQSLPSICSEVGHICTVSDGSGAFTMQIDAVIGDGIAVVLIDADGNEISPRTLFEIPSSGLASLMVGCDTEAVYGKLVDMYNLRGVPITLFEGSASSQNTLQIGSGSSAYAVALPGCYAKALAVYPGMSGVDLISVISDEDHVLWSGLWIGSGIIGVSEGLLINKPLAIAFSNDPNYAIVATGTGSSFQLERIALLDGTTPYAVTIPDPPTGETLDGVLAVRTIGPFFDGTWLGAVVTKGLDISLNQQFFFIFFDANNLTSFSELDENLRLGYEAGDGEGALFSVTTHDISDVRLAADVTNNNNVMFVVADRDNGKLHVAHLQRDAAYDVSLNSNIFSELVSAVYLSYDSVYDYRSSAMTVTPRRMALGVSGGSPMAYVLTDELNLWTVSGYETDLYGEIVTPISGAANPVAIGCDDIVQSVLVGDDSLKDILDISSLWGGGM